MVPTLRMRWSPSLTAAAQHAAQHNQHALLHPKDVLVTYGSHSQFSLILRFCWRKPCARILDLTWSSPSSTRPSESGTFLHNNTLLSHEPILCTWIAQVRVCEHKCTSAAHPSINELTESSLTCGGRHPQSSATASHHPAIKPASSLYRIRSSFSSWPLAACIRKQSCYKKAQQGLCSLSAPFCLSCDAASGRT